MSVSFAVKISFIYSVFFFFLAVDDPDDLPDNFLFRPRQREPETGLEADSRLREPVASTSSKKRLSAPRQWQRECQLLVFILIIFSRHLMTNILVVLLPATLETHVRELLMLKTTPIIAPDTNKNNLANTHSLSRSLSSDSNAKGRGDRGICGRLATGSCGCREFVSAQGAVGQSPALLQLTPFEHYCRPAFRIFTLLTLRPFLRCPGVLLRPLWWFLELDLWLFQVLKYGVVDHRMSKLVNTN